VGAHQRIRGYCRFTSLPFVLYTPRPYLVLQATLDWSVRHTRRDAVGYACALRLLRNVGFSVQPSTHNTFTYIHALNVLHVP
jgi:hypothetical protein